MLGGKHYQPVSDKFKCMKGRLLTARVVILGLTLFVRQQLAPLDLEELQRARYEYKGA